MDHFRLRKYRGSEVWERVKEAYLAGEGARSVALRFDVSVANLRKKASEGGWTRRAEAARTDLKPLRGHGLVAAIPPPVDGSPRLAPEPREQLADGLRLASRRMAEGRPQEAEALVRAARALMDLTGETPPTMAELSYDPTDEIENVVKAIEIRALQLVRAILSPEPQPPVDSAHVYFTLRAARRATRDREVDDLPWVEANRPDLRHLWDAEGELIMPPLMPSEPQAHAIAALLAAGIYQRRDGDLKTFFAAGRPRL